MGGRVGGHCATWRSRLALSFSSSESTGGFGSPLRRPHALHSVPEDRHFDVSVAPQQRQCRAFTTATQRAEIDASTREGMIDRSAHPMHCCLRGSAAAHTGQRSALKRVAVHLLASGRQRPERVSVAHAWQLAECRRAHMAGAHQVMGVPSTRCVLVRHASRIVCPRWCCSNWRGRQRVHLARRRSNPGDRWAPRAGWARWCPIQASIARGEAATAPLENEI